MHAVFLLHKVLQQGLSNFSVADNSFSLTISFLNICPITHLYSHFKTFQTDTSRAHLSRYLPSPLIEAEVAVGKLLKQRPLNNSLGRLVLEEVDQRVLQTSILLGGGLLLGELVQAGILFVEGLKEPENAVIVCGFHASSKPS